MLSWAGQVFRHPTRVLPTLAIEMLLCSDALTAPQQSRGLYLVIDPSRIAKRRLNVDGTLKRSEECTIVFGGVAPK